MLFVQLKVLWVSFVAEALSHYVSHEPLRAQSQNVNKQVSLREPGRVANIGE